MHKTSPKITANNNVRLLLDGKETFSVIQEAIRNAKKCINLEYFLISDDRTGRIIKSILTERALAGVRVRVIFDAAGSWRLGRKFVSELENAGVQVKRFRPFTWRNINAGIIHRDHRKIITIDDKKGLLGGFNIGDIYLSQWRDTHLMIEGEAVKVLDDIFADMWRKSGGDIYVPNYHAANQEGNVPIKILASGTGKDFRAIANEYTDIISHAEKRVWITTPYLVPDKVFRRSLYEAVKRGVDIRIIIPSRSNHTLASWASQSYINELLRHGVRIFIYRDRFIHAKTLIADTDIASVGTANIDTLSFGVNYEVQAFMYSQKIVDDLGKVFIADMEHCSEELLMNRKSLPFSLRLKSGIGRLLSRWL